MSVLPIAAVLLTVVLVALPSGSATASNPTTSYQQGDDAGYRTEKRDNGGRSGHVDSRVNTYRGPMNYSTREVIDDPYNTRIYVSPCNGGPVNNEPIIYSVNYEGESLQLKLASSVAQSADPPAPQGDVNLSAPVVDTLEYNPANPPQYYFAVCQYAVPGEGTPGPDDRADVEAWVRDYFRLTKLPRPVITMSAQNGGICGVRHTANLNMNPEMLFTEGETPFGSLNMHVYGRVTVNWGDGGINIYSNGGGNYPDSPISHVWKDRGDYTIASRVDWIANYSLGPYNGITYNGVVSGVATTATPLAFPVWEAQAMVTG